MKSSDEKHFPFSRSDCNNGFNKRMNKTHPKMWAFIARLQGKEVIFRQQSLKLKTGAQKTLAMQKQIDNSCTRFYNDDSDRAELLVGLSLLVASKK